MVQPDHAPVRRSRLPAGTKIVVALLLGIPVGVLLWVGLYNQDSPELWGFPFFYWFQFLLIPITAAATWIAYLLVRRSPREEMDEEERR